MTQLLDVPLVGKLRKEKGLSQAEAAAKADISRQRWNDIEKGRKENMEIATLYAIAKALNCDPCDLLLKRPGRAKAGKP
jgi:transcriptional regulator with XRE-family HTH domain